MYEAHTMNCIQTELVYYFKQIPSCDKICERHLFHIVSLIKLFFFVVEFNICNKFRVTLCKSGAIRLIIIKYRFAYQLCRFY